MSEISGRFKTLESYALLTMTFFFTNELKAREFAGLKVKINTRVGIDVMLTEN